jgi:hemerythrin-like domain-containing protein
MARAVAARAYDGFLRAHIALETTALFPLMAQVLPPDRDATLALAFAAIEERRIGRGTHERLHGFIDSLGPRIAAVCSA